MKIDWLIELGFNRVYYVSENAIICVKVEGEGSIVSGYVHM